MALNNLKRVDMPSNKEELRIKNLLNMKVAAIPIVNDAFKTVFKGLVKGLEE